jgi:hypothetical protein
MIFVASHSQLVMADGQLSRKADLVLQFAYYVTWSKSTSELVFCAVGSAKFADALEKKVKGKEIQGRKSVVQQGQGGNCNIIVGISASVRGGNGVLTVSDVGNFAQNGGMIEFVPEGNKVFFEINNKVAKSRGVKISSQLLKLAKKVH